jgi:hypothetical protein
MPADPRQCRFYAARCFALAKRVREPKTRRVFIKMAETWNRLAAEAESDQTQSQSISEMELGETDDAMPTALKLRLGEYA